MSTAADVRKKLKEDFEFYAKHCLKIRTKEGEIKPFFPLKPAQMILHNEIERQLRTTGYVRIIILKARQQGLSTYIEGRNYFENSQRTGGKGLVLTHKSDSTDSLFTMTKRFHDSCPDAVRPSTKYQSKRELFFDKLDSQITVATAGGEGVARGETNTLLHASEIAFWPKSTARTTWNGLRQSVGDKPGTHIYIESTANGMGNLFHELVLGAYKKELSEGVYTGDSEYALIFIPWFLDPDYATTPPVDFSPTPSEEDLIEQFPHLSFAQLYWRRLKIAEVGRDLFMQEYPATVEEAFISSGRPVFNIEQVSALIKANIDREPKRMALTASDVWEEDPRGELTVYRDPDPTERYVIGADVSKGIRGGDWSVAQVLDSKRRQCAVWRGQVVSDYFATVLYHLGMRYNVAELVPEANDHGILTCYMLQKVLNYPYIHQTIRVDQVTDKETIVVGFTTNAKTKPLVIDGLRAALRENSIEVVDVPTLKEMSTYILNENGKMEAESGAHDDCVMSLAIANYAAKDMAEPISVDDSFYEDTID